MNSYIGVYNIYKYILHSCITSRPTWHPEFSFEHFHLLVELRQSGSMWMEMKRQCFGSGPSVSFPPRMLPDLLSSSSSFVFAQCQASADLCVSVNLHLFQAADLRGCPT